MLKNKKVFAHIARVPLESIQELFRELHFQVCVALRKHVPLRRNTLKGPLAVGVAVAGQPHCKKAKEGVMGGAQHEWVEHTRHP